MNIYVQRDDVSLAEIHRFRFCIQNDIPSANAEPSNEVKNSRISTLPATSTSLLGLRNSPPDSGKSKNELDKEKELSISGSVQSSLKSFPLAENRYSALPSAANKDSTESAEKHRPSQHSDLTPTNAAANVSEAQSTPIYENESSSSVRRSSMTDHTVPLSRSPSSVLWVRVRNKEPRFRQAAYLQGPFTLCVSVWNDQFSSEENSLLNFEPQVQPSSSFWVCIPYVCYSNEKPIYIEIVSQAIFKDRPISFELAIATTQQSIRAMSAADVDTLHAFPSLHIEHTPPSALWKIPPSSFHAEKSHLVILTHGMHSNVGADMEYLKEQILNAADKNGELVVVRGYRGNYCQTEKGVRWLGKRLAEWLLEIVGWETSSFPRYSHISLVAHSLGGLVQTYAAGYVHAKTHGCFFQAIHPVHFVTLATPWLGVAAEHPSYVGKALSYGIIGRTGQDLALTSSAHPIEPRPFLVVMSDRASPFHQAVSLFEHRTLFANTTNDYIVPYGTSSMKPHSLGQLDSVMDDDKGNSPAASQDLSDTHPADQSTSTMSNKPSEINIHSDSIPNTGSRSRKRSTSFTNAFKALTGLFSTPSSQHALPDDANNKLPNAQDPRNSKVENTTTEAVNAPNQAYLYPVKKSESKSTLSGFTNRLINTFTNLLIPAVPSYMYFLKFKSLNSIVSDETCEPTSGESYNIDSFLSTERKPSKTTTDFLLNEKIISSNWHQLSWRKVSVHLDGDAHNSLFVRRRFPNAYGWSSVGHLTDILFQNNNLETYSNPIQFDELTTAAWLSEIYEEHDIV
ncbi:lipase [Schizosaccharomyces cryophilus OY26]|uniref:Lipase n=1 Tax=Schizosaccharomyces cryophilus (strain OY26 / ATCC MYA-4695 / CBS 11777 / NBRC 106824 / NRRL Y48691) TaxID=653667 RepID=S9W377_SCHCR|nr:lipase [Schizosaccharomyces cryophilus OY26]EPY52400.1 lipase [Schizosaccharomyces cryophilus OY26]